MDNLRELYQEIILDHNKNPKNFCVLARFTHSAEGNNPLCGDQLTIYLNVEDDVIREVSFQGSGCAISKASASVMTTELQGKSKDEVHGLFKEFQTLITRGLDDPADLEGLGKLAVFAGVKEYPVRVKCAGLPWHTMLAALKDSDHVVSTE
jgi:nitrogen fixation NifU-like protein